MMFVRRRAPLIEQRHRLAKRVLLAPIAPLVQRWALSVPPNELKALALRRLVVPQVGAAARDYVLDVPQGFRYGGNTRDLLGLMVYLFGTWEPNLCRFLRRRLSPGDTFIDVGANSGWFTTLGAKSVGDQGRVVAVEASPEIATRLRRNLELNGVTNARVVVAAATSERCRMNVVPGPDEHTGLTRVDRRPGLRMVEVTGDTLVSLLSDEEITSARVVKVDVEGAEFDVVRGIAPALDRFPASCEFVIEVGPDRALNPEQVGELFATFASAGYRPYRLPNFYDVRSYLMRTLSDALELVTAVPTTETDVVFSRLGDSLLRV